MHDLYEINKQQARDDVFHIMTTRKLSSIETSCEDFFRPSVSRDRGNRLFCCPTCGVELNE